MTPQELFLVTLDPLGIYGEVLQRTSRIVYAKDAEEAVEAVRETYRCAQIVDVSQCIVGRSRLPTRGVLNDVERLAVQAKANARIRGVGDYTGYIPAILSYQKRLGISLKEATEDLDNETDRLVATLRGEA